MIPPLLDQLYPSPPTPVTLLVSPYPSALMICSPLSKISTIPSSLLLMFIYHFCPQCIAFSLLLCACTNHILPLPQYLHSSPPPVPISCWIHPPSLPMCNTHPLSILCWCNLPSLLPSFFTKCYIWSGPLTVV